MGDCSCYFSLQLKGTTKKVEVRAGLSRLTPKLSRVINYELPMCHSGWVQSDILFTRTRGFALHEIRENQVDRFVDKY